MHAERQAANIRRWLVSKTTVRLTAAINMEYDIPLRKGRLCISSILIYDERSETVSRFVRSRGESTPETSITACINRGNLTGVCAS